MALAAPQNQGSQSSNIPTTVQMVRGKKVVAVAASTLKVRPAQAVSGVRAAADSTNNAVIDISFRWSTPTAAVAGANAFANGLISVLQAQTDAQIRGLQQQLASVQDQIQKLQGANQNNPVKQAELTAAIGQYSTLTTQISTLTLQGAPASMLQEATGAASDASSKASVLALAGVIGLILGCGVALIRDQFDTRLRTVSQVEEVGDTAVLAEVPFDSSYRGHTQVLPVRDKPQSAMAQAIRELRTATQVLLGDANSPVLVITSPAPLDGKTILTANLAASFALSGKHVVVLSGDLRRPRMDAFFGVNGNKGLAELIDSGSSAHHPDTAETQVIGRPYINGQAIADLLVPTEIDGLMLLPSGSAGPDPADAVASAVMGGLVEELRSLADVVVIDTPPVLAVADASIIGSYADGVVIVVRSGKTKAEMLGEAVKRLRSARVRILGVALNRSRSVSTTMYRSYSQSPRKPIASEKLGRHDQTEVSGASADAPDSAAEPVAASNPTDSGAEQAVPDPVVAMAATESDDDAAPVGSDALVDDPIAEYQPPAAQSVAEQEPPSEPEPEALEEPVDAVPEPEAEVIEEVVNATPEPEARGVESAVSGPEAEAVEEAMDAQHEGEAEAIAEPVEQAVVREDLPQMASLRSDPPDSVDGQADEEDSAELSLEDELFDHEEEDEYRRRRVNGARPAQTGWRPMGPGRRRIPLARRPYGPRS